MILRNILRYYYENDIKKFYKVYNSEIGLITKSKTTSKLEFDKLFNSVTKDYLIKRSSTVHETPQPATKIGKLARRLRESAKRDGMYLTGEKIVRKVHSKAIKRR